MITSFQFIVDLLPARNARWQLWWKPSSPRMPSPLARNLSTACTRLLLADLFPVFCYSSCPWRIETLSVRVTRWESLCIWKRRTQAGDGLDIQGIDQWGAAASLLCLCLAQLHPFQVGFFAWLLLQNRIQCKVNLAKKGVLTDATCELFKRNNEDVDHIILSCDFAR